MTSQENLHFEKGTASLVDTCEAILKDVSAGTRIRSTLLSSKATR